VQNQLKPAGQERFNMIWAEKKQESQYNTFHRVLAFTTRSPRVVLVCPGKPMSFVIDS
jgi:hypothetical protein